MDIVDIDCHIFLKPRAISVKERLDMVAKANEKQFLSDLRVGKFR